MAVALDAIGTEATNFPGSSSGVTYTGLTISGGLTNSALLVIVNTGNNGATPPTGLSATWNGVNVPIITGTTINRAGGDFQINMLGLANPASGNQSLVISWGGGTYSYSIVALSFQGADQTTPFINGTTNTATSGSLSVAITSPTGDYAVGGYGLPVT